MKNNKGFTVVELVVSFVLISIVAIMMFNLIISLKELYISADIKTSLLNKQGIITKKIYNDLNTKKLKSIRSCGVSCLTFMYENNENGIITNVPVQLMFDVAANTIKYDDYLMELKDGSKITSETDNHVLLKYENSILYINIPIKTTFLDDDFGIHIVKKIENCTVDTKLKYSDATIIANTIPMKLSKLNFEDSDFIRNFSHEPNYTKVNKYASFARIFHQTRLDDDGTVIEYKDYDDFIKNKNDNKLSTLKSLETFRSIDKTKDLIDEITADPEVDNKYVKESFENGYFELLLSYPNSDNELELKNYNWWIQTSNFVNNQPLENFVNFDTAFPGTDSGKWLSGLKLIDNNKCFVTGTGSGNYFTLGSKNSNELIGSTGKVDKVDLWIRVDEYIQKYKFCDFDESAQTIILTFDGNGGGVFQEQIALTSGMKIVLPSPTKKDQDFEGWYTERNGGSKVTNDTIWTSSQRLYAHWN